MRGGNVTLRTDGTGRTFRRVLSHTRQLTQCDAAAAARTHDVCFHFLWTQADTLSKPLLPWRPPACLYVLGRALPLFA